MYVSRPQEAGNTAQLVGCLPNMQEILGFDHQAQWSTPVVQTLGK